jgi:hypothetical protein
LYHIDGLAAAAGYVVYMNDSFISLYEGFLLAGDLMLKKLMP